MSSRSSRKASWVPLVYPRPPAGTGSEPQDLCLPERIDQTWGTCTGLTYLDFCTRTNRRDEDVTDPGVEALSGMTALQSLNLAGHRQVSSEGLAWLVHCTAMTSLDLSGDS